VELEQLWFVALVEPDLILFQLGQAPLQLGSVAITQVVAEVAVLVLQLPEALAVLVAADLAETTI
jgi:hypothetical protein